MEASFKKMLKGYRAFRKKYAQGKKTVMHYLSSYGQKPEIMVIACCDSRVDPALILQCDPGDLFVVRNIANIVPPYEKDGAHHGTSAALEFGVCFLKVKHLVLLGHSQCGGIEALSKGDDSPVNDFITSWVSVIDIHNCGVKTTDEYAKMALEQSYQNCLSFPWIAKAVANKELLIHVWFFDIKTGEIFRYFESQKAYQPLDAMD